MQYLLYEYDEKGNVSRITQYNANGSIIYGMYTFEYDTQNRMVRRNFYDGRSGTVLVGYDIYEYDENGNLIRSTYYNNMENGQIAYYFVYEYDETGKQIRCTEYSGDGSVRQVEESW